MNESNYLPRRQPFLYLVMALVVGILTDKFFQPPRLNAALLLSVSMLAAGWFMFKKSDFTATLALLFGVVCIGALLAQVERTNVKASRLQKLFEKQILTANEPVEFTGILTAPPEPAIDASYLDVEAENVVVFKEEIVASGRVKLFMALPDNQTVAEFQQLGLDYGSRIRVLVRLERAHAYKNPGAIDFNEFLERQGFDLKGTVKSPLLVEVSGHLPVSRMLAALYHFRLRAMNAIDARFKQPVAGTLKAMLFGSRYFLDAETGERLRESATFHTLVISGMHITLIAWVLLSLPAALLPFKRRTAKYQRRRPGLFRVMLALMVLWAYTLMVGLAPPVTRATVMISVGLIAPLLFRRAASVNTLSLAAFLLLALKPALVADPGFQLSFIAVAAIVTLVLPVVAKIQSIGAWRPLAAAPRPPICPLWLRRCCEILFWDQRAFNREMEHSPITYGLDKSRLAVVLNRMRLQWLLRDAVVLLITSTAIQLLTLPLTAFYFNRVAPIGILLNLFSGVLTGVMMFSAIGAIVFGLMNAGFATPLVLLTNLAHYLLVHSIVPFAKIPAMTFRVAHYQGGPAVTYALYFIPIAGLAFLIDNWLPLGSRQRAVGSTAVSLSKALPEPDRERTVPKRKSKRRLTAYGLLLTLVVAVFAVMNPPKRLPQGKLTLYFLDVGQGDSALVVFPQGTTMLIDGGGELSFAKSKEKNRETGTAMAEWQTPNQPQNQEGGEAAEAEFNEPSFAVGEAVVSRFLWSLGLTRIDYVVATHADADHIGGLAPVVKNLQVREALVGRVATGNPEFDQFVQATRARQTPLATFSAGQRFDIEGVRVEVLYPQALGQVKERSNNTSIVLRFIYGSTSILMTGDIEKEAEEALVKSGFSLHAEVMKVAHHGSKTSSTEAFLDAVEPRLAIISVGERSRFGHPHRAVIERFRKRGIRLLQTGRSGLITLESDGMAFAVKPYVK